MLAELFELSAAIPYGVLGAKAGISAAFTFLYFAVVNYFPQEFIGLVMGTYNIFGRFSTILSPMVAE